MYRTFQFWIFPDDAVIPDIPRITPPDFVALFQNIRQIVFIQFRCSFLCFLAIVKHLRSPFILWPSSSLDFHTLPATTVRRSAAPIPSGQTGLDASRQAQFSAGIVILRGVRREPPTSAWSDQATGGTDQTRTGGLLIPNQARYQLRYGSVLAADGGVDPHGFRRALFSRQAPRPLEFICRIGWRFCTMHDQESNLTVWGLEPRCTSKDDRHPILRGIGHHHAMSASADIALWAARCPALQP